MTAGPSMAGRPLDRHGVRDVVVARRLRVVVQRRDLELVDAGLDLDRVPTAERVRLHDRRAQGALVVRGGTHAVARRTVDLVGGAGDGERPAGVRERALEPCDRDERRPPRRRRQEASLPRRLRGKPNALRELRSTKGPPRRNPSLPNRLHDFSPYFPR